MASDDARADGLLYVVLPVHDRREVTAKFIACLQRQTDRNFHLLLVDDGSRDGTADMVRAAGLPLSVITGNGDWWWAGALQQAYDWLRARPRAGGEVVLIMNDDTLFEPGFIAAGRAALAAAPRSLLLARRHSSTGEFLDAGVKTVWSKLQFLPTRDAAEVDCFSTRGLFLRLDDFLALGGFYPTLLPHYASDYEFTIRARRRGYRLASDPSVQLRFDASTTGDLDPRADSVADYLRRCFSKRFALNPLYWSTFILLACPAIWILPNLFRVWAGFLGQLKDAARGGRTSA